MIAALVAVISVSIAGLTLRSGGTTEARSGSTPTPTPSVSASPTVSEIYRQVGPSVVVIRTARGALGTGVVAADDGTIVTANHVIADGSAIGIVFADGTRSTARVASADAAIDIAILTPGTSSATLVPATFGGAVEVGGSVVAIGNPLGLAYSVSSGVISGVGRTATIERGKLSGLIQFDASVNPGSSGGPLLDAQGNVIGIVISIADPGGDDAFAGIAFAVPIGTALGGANGTGQGPQI